MSELFMVLTRLGFVQVFAGWPTYNAVRERWGGRLIYTLDPATVRDLYFTDVLTLDQPRRFSIDPAGESRWRLHHDGEDTQILIAAITFCFRLDTADGALIPMESAEAARV